MPEALGAHLLGRVSVPDERDYQLTNFLTADPLDAALTAVLAKHYSKALKTWAQLVTERITIADTSDVVWVASAVLDQGDTPHCVGFGWAGWGDTDPVDDHYVDADGHAIYAECKAIDGEPGQQNGSSVRSGAKAMQGRGRLDAYAFSHTVDEVRAWLHGHGPVVFGTDWLASMFSPDENGLVIPTGPVEGGHCYLCVGDLARDGMLLFQNSWGDWGQGGRFTMRYDDVQALLDAQGDACAAVELPA